MHNDTITAIATPQGSGAIAVIRVSGDNAITITEKIFQSAKKNKKLSEQKANTLHFGSIRTKDEIIDEVLVSIFKAPHSYTGENSVEISCHASSHIQSKILELLIQNGARLAQPGEFTLRAFRNGKMDLSQAEAVADLIASSSESARRVAMKQMRGGFRDEIQNLRSQLLDFISLIELELDFAEEDVEFADRSELKNLVSNIAVHIQKLIASFKLGNVIKNGVPVAIIGAPNVGKSTLLNALLNEDKAIVSDIPGTTRDSIEDVVNLHGVLFRFIDTAGIRNTTDTIENLGIERTFSKVNDAEIILLMADATQNNIEDIIQTVKAKIKDKKTLLVINKTDLLKKELILPETDCEHIEISAKNRENINRLIDKLIEIAGISAINKDEVIISNIRHYEALNHAFKALERVQQGLQEGISSDFLSMDIREILHFLGEISGEISNDEILGNIFKNFCIGK
ncbi:MAG: tRNA uridine-5-carboxymethylaminomethyl(34) synthesis GTPase MnmE [Bacteroidales bacterium]|nr:tRNA uridine-5-carboxymethylaminomethyl(34) synthesis GTPase MnmE [Bacteroidales bacterium]